jgi:hypothetical protein
MIVILGSNGNLSQALQKNKTPFLVIERSDFWSSDSVQASISRLEKKITEILSNSSEGIVIINTIGLVDPNQDLETLLKVNSIFPSQLQLLCNSLEIKLVTLGSVYEENPKILNSNRYLYSKNNFVNWLQNNNPERKFSLHLQFHSWYAGVNNHKHMFLPQLLESIKNNCNFQLNNPTLKREFHHVDDDATIVLKLARSSDVGKIGISSGDILTLETVALEVLEQFQMGHKLFVDEKSRVDNLEWVKEYKVLDAEKFRPTIEGIVMDFRHKLGLAI